jgi:hypothetical protein
MLKCPCCNTKLSFQQFLDHVFKMHVLYDGYKCPKCNQKLVHGWAGVVVTLFLFSGLFVADQLVEHVFTEFSFYNLILGVGISVGYTITVIYIYWLIILLKCKYI